MEAGPRLAVAIEKDRDARAALVAGLRRGGIARLRRRSRPDEARQLIRDGSELRLLAIGVGDPPDAALELIRDCRHWFPEAVILVVDHRCCDDSVAEAFKAGADDVVRAPYAESELVARLVRRLGESVPTDGALASFTETHLSPVEGRILRFLFDRRGEIVTRNELARAIDNTEWTYGDRRFDVHITKIRRKLEGALSSRVQVKTIRSAGYRLETKDG